MPTYVVWTVAALTSVLAPQAHGATELASISSAERAARGFSHEPSISADGRFVAFTSSASNLAPRDGNGHADVFVRDRSTGLTELVSRTPRGVSGDRASYDAAISPDGRFVAFCSYASDLAPGDRQSRGARPEEYEPYRDVFLHDRRTRRTRMVSAGSTATVGDVARTPRVGSCAASVSAGGAVVAYLVETTRRPVSDIDRPRHVMAWTARTGRRRMLDVTPDGRAGNGKSSAPEVSADGRVVAFNSGATDLVAGDVNGVNDTFAVDLQGRTVRRVSVARGGRAADGDSIGSVDVSANGRFIAFVSYARSLGPSTGHPDADLFVRDASTGDVVLASRTHDGSELNSSVGDFDLSFDGRYVTFATSAGGVTTAADVDPAQDIYLRSLGNGAVRLLTPSNEGASLGSSGPSVSRGGAHVAFASDGADLVDRPDPNSATDVFVWSSLGR